MTRAADIASEMIVASATPTTSRSKTMTKRRSNAILMIPDMAKK